MHPLCTDFSFKMETTFFISHQLLFTLVLKFPAHYLQQTLLSSDFRFLNTNLIKSLRGITALLKHPLTKIAF